MNTHICKVVIVDDEPIILRSLQKAIPWQKLGLTLCGVARNGEEALDIVKRERPDIIISDIRMPSIDGITLMRMVMEMVPDTWFIILSGYGEFEYAREAIRYGAFNYLLKPIDHDELQEVLFQAKQRVDEQRESTEEQELLRRSVQSLSSVVRERMFSAIIEGTDSPEFRRSIWLDEWELDTTYRMGLVTLDDYDKMIRHWSPEERRLWYFAVGNILQEYWQARGCYTVFPFHNGEWLFIVQHTDAAALCDAARELIAKIKHCTKLSVSVAISRPHRHIRTLQESYHSCREALSRRFISGKEEVYVDEERLGSVWSVSMELEAERDSGAGYPLRAEKALSEHVRTLDILAFEAELTRLEQQLAIIAAPRHAVCHMLIQLTIVLHRQLEAYHPLRSMDVDPLLQQLTVSSTLDEMISAMRRVFCTWVKEASSSQGDRLDAASIVQRVVDYVDDHYHLDLGIDELADMVGLSCSHFCVLFKRETGSTFLEYLTKYRIDRACSILRQSEVKVYQIAPLVGYQDPRYFTQVFKKITGLTPSEYRMSQLSS